MNPIAPFFKSHMHAPVHPHHPPHGDHLIGVDRSQIATGSTGDQITQSLHHISFLMSAPYIKNLVINLLNLDVEVLSEERFNQLMTASNYNLNTFFAKLMEQIGPQPSHPLVTSLMKQPQHLTYIQQGFELFLSQNIERLNQTVNQLDAEQVADLMTQFIQTLDPSRVLSLPPMQIDQDDPSQDALESDQTDHVTERNELYIQLVDNLFETILSQVPLDDTTDLLDQLKEHALSDRCREGSIFMFSDQLKSVFETQMRSLLFTQFKNSLQQFRQEQTIRPDEIGSFRCWSFFYASMKKVITKYVQLYLAAYLDLKAYLYPPQEEIELTVITESDLQEAQEPSSYLTCARTISEFAKATLRTSVNHTCNTFEKRHIQPLSPSPSTGVIGRTTHVVAQLLFTQSQVMIEKQLIEQVEGYIDAQEASLAQTVKEQLEMFNDDPRGKQNCLLSALQQLEHNLSPQTSSEQSTQTTERSDRQEALTTILLGERPGESMARDLFNLSVAREERVLLAQPYYVQGFRSLTLLSSTTLSTLLKLPLVLYQVVFATLDQIKIVLMANFALIQMAYYQEDQLAQRLGKYLWETRLLPMVQSFLQMLSPFNLITTPSSKWSELTAPIWMKLITSVIDLDQHDWSSSPVLGKAARLVNRGQAKLLSSALAGPGTMLLDSAIDRVKHQAVSPLLTDDLFTKLATSIVNQEQE